MGFSIKKILTSNHDFTPDEYELKLRFVLFNSLVLSNVIFIGFVIAYRLSTHQTAIALIDLLYMLFGLLAFFWVQISKASLHHIMWLVIFFSFIFVTILFYRNLNPLIGISFYILLFLVTYVLQGHQASITIFILSVSTIFYISLTQQNLSLPDTLIGLLPFETIAFFLYIFHQYNEKIKQELQDQKQRYAHLAHYDSLTEIPNRNALLTFFEYALVARSNTETKLAVLFIDLDDFKQVNDRYGHTMGDRVLRLVAERLRRQIRGADMLARHGGDEFVIVAQSITERQDIEKVLAHIFQAMQEPIVDVKRSIRITLSIGIAITPQDGTHIDDLLKHADQAMYHAKKSGKNTYSFYEDIKENTPV